VTTSIPKRVFWYRFLDEFGALYVDLEIVVGVASVKAHDFWEFLAFSCIQCVVYFEKFLFLKLYIWLLNLNLDSAVVLIASFPIESRVEILAIFFTRRAIFFTLIVNVVLAVHSTHCTGYIGLKLSYLKIKCEWVRVHVVKRREAAVRVISYLRSCCRVHILSWSEWMHKHNNMSTFLFLLLYFHHHMGVLQIGHSQTSQDSQYQ